MKIPLTGQRSTIGIPQVAAVLVCAAGLAVLLFPLGGFSPEQTRAAVLAIVAVGFWASGALPEHLTALSFFLFAMLFAVAPAGVIFSGFASAALWLVFAGLVLGVAVTGTGLGGRIAHCVARRLKGTYPALIGGTVAIGLALGFLMPSSMGRVVLLIPIALALAERFGFGAGSNGRTGVVLAAAFGSHVPTFAILPANVPNMVLVGASESLFKISPLYGEYLLLHFPVLGLLKAVVIVLLILWLYPDRPAPAHADAPPPSPLSRGEWKLSWVLMVSLALWMTDFIHHISPAWVGLGAAVFLLLPRVGLVSGEQFNGKINYGSLFFVAGIMGMGAMVAHTGLGDRLAQALLALLPLEPGHHFLSYVSLTFTSLITGVVTTLPGVPAVLTPLAAKMAHASGLPLKTVLMTQVLGFSTTIFPYQSAPLVVAMQLAGIRLAPALKLSLVLAVITLVVLLPLDFWWWRALGWL